MPHKPTRRRRQKSKSEVVDPPSPAWIELLRNLARLLTLAVVAFGPWYYGSATWNAQLVCVLASTFLAVIACLLGPWNRRPSLIHVGVAGLILLVLIQCVPLPTTIWEWASPNAHFAAEVTTVASEIADRIPEFDQAALAESQLKYPSTISLFSDLSLAGGAVLASALGMLICGSILFSGTRIWQLGLLVTLMVVGLSNAVVGLLQAVAWNGWTLLPMSTNNFFSTFINRNSVAQFYSIAIGATLALLVYHYQKRQSDQTDRRYQLRYPAVNFLARLRRRLEELLSDADTGTISLLVIIAFLFSAVLAAASRGGILSCSFAMIATVAYLSTKRNSWVTLVVLLVGGALSFGFLSMFDLTSKVSERLDTVSEEFHQLSNSRLDLWAAILRESQYWLTGSGYGTFHLAVTTSDLNTHIWFYHAENIYVEVFVTLGILGLLIALTMLGWLLLRLVFAKVSKEHSAFLLAVMFPTLAIAIQSTVDFSLILPAIFLPLSLLIGTFSGEISRPRQESKTFSSFWGFMPLAITMLLAVLCGTGVLIDLGRAETLARRSPQRTSLTVNEAFEVARQRQQQVWEVLGQANWPSDLSEEEIRSLSRPILASAAARSGSEELQQVAEQLAADPRLIQVLNETYSTMVDVTNKTSQDWRICWGLVQSDTGEVGNVGTRVENLARLLVTTQQRAPLLLEIGSSHLLAGEHQLGLHCLRAAVTRSPKLLKRLPAFAPKLDADDVMFIIPSDPLVIASVARDMEAASGLMASELSDKVDLAEIKNLAESWEDWALVAWLADQQQAKEEHFEALSTASRLAPFEADLNFQLANLFFEEGEFEKAMEEIDRALNRSMRAEYRVLKDKISEFLPK